MTSLLTLDAGPQHRVTQRAAARKSFDSAELLWVSTDAEPADRIAADETLRVLYRHSAKASLTALTPDGQLARWADPAAWDLEVPAAVRVLVSNAVVAQLASGNLEAPASSEEARREAEGLLALAEETQRAVERIRARRIAGIGAVVVVAIGIAAITTSIAARITAPVDLAKGKPWTASSKFADCHPDKQECGGAKTTIFFHTQEEENPWIQIDLQSPTSISAATIENRLDLGLERAMPLVLEVSSDGAGWHEVARREKVFETWKPSFPAEIVRFVRVRVPRRSILHLSAVRIHP